MVLRRRNELQIDVHLDSVALDSDVAKTLFGLTLPRGLMKGVLAWRAPDEPKIPIFVARIGSEIVGWGCLGLPHYDYHLISVYVRPKNRRQGIGEQIVRAIHGYSKGKRHFLRARYHSSVGRKFYEKMRSEMSRLSVHAC